MSRITPRLAALKAQRRTALIPYLTAGDPDLGTTLALMHTAVAAGADILEIGVPFSDPCADGPVIQAASERALCQGVRLVDVLALVSQFRASDDETPVVLMGYLNPVEIFGYGRFADAAASAGVDGLILVDLPPEEAAQFEPLLAQAGIDLIYLVAPTTTPERARMIARHARGYLYYVSLKGVTGAGHLDVADVAARVTQLREFTTLPVAVGFGIKDGASAAAVARHADGVVVGSALVERIGRLGHAPAQASAAVAALIGELRQALDHSGAA
ncbi:MAG: tryptophan synthase subunit alpha [Pseudomonadales bacterium]|jgi:tryptophan synthase alpha chain|nr:tryptophan synthase subunit alpha [Pseudomonadales bacterium]HMU90521.1 tryptophan synthase subunit alpha [Pseudomonadales bacterium]HMW15323.1 tryptophan synthase subunit alpha [Pseudomonadales bacterium]HMW83558.1 tryptophan synthase subunit alpha [Pseudomonadales bacterium]HMY97254.1 tryptophan synthase subunit alpha [Pseudomonadales bacterium]